MLLEMFGAARSALPDIAGGETGGHVLERLTHKRATILSYTLIKQALAEHVCSMYCSSIDLKIFPP